MHKRTIVQSLFTAFKQAFDPSDKQAFDPSEQQQTTK
jgi:hypothetical protein